MSSDLKYLATHEWFRLDDDGTTVGISEFAQEQLNDVVFVELPEVGRTVEKGEAVAVVESCKTASDVYSPVAGEIVAINEALEAAPELINQEPVGGGWLFKVKPADGFDPDDSDYLNDEQYKASIV